MNGIVERTPQIRRIIDLFPARQLVRDCIAGVVGQEQRWLRSLRGRS